MNYESTLQFDSKVIPGVTYTLHKPSYGRTLEFDRKNAGFRAKARGLQKRQDELREELDFVRKEWDTEQEQTLKELREELSKATEGDTSYIQAHIDRIENGYEYERLIDRSRIVTDEEHVKDIADKLVAIGDNKTVFRMPAELADGFRDLKQESDFLTADEYYPARLKWGLAKIEGIEIDGAPANADLLILYGPPDLTREIISQIDEINSMSPEKLRNFQSRSTSDAAEDGNANNTTATAA